MYFINIVLSFLLRRKLRTILTIIGFGISIMSFTTFIGLSVGFEKTWSEVYSARKAQIIVIKKDSPTFLSSNLRETVKKELVSIDGVSSAGGVLVDFKIVGGSIVVPILGWDSDMFRVSDLSMSGKIPSGREKEIVMGYLLAKNIRKQIGDIITFQGQDYKITGVFKSESFYNNSGVIMELGALQEVMDRRGEVTEYDVQVKRDRLADIDSIRRDIEKKIPGVEAFSPDILSRDNMWMTAFREFAWSISLVAVLVALIGIVNTLNISILEKRKEIGILLAVGWRKTRIQKLIICESLIIALTGWAGGVVLGFLIIEIFPHIPVVTRFFRGEITIGVVLYALILSILVGIISGLIVSVKTMKFSPIELLRYE